MKVPKGTQTENSDVLGTKLAPTHPDPSDSNKVEPKKMAETSKPVVEDIGNRPNDNESKKDIWVS